MSYLVLARKLRPQSFEDIVGQEALVRTLGNALSSGRIHHAFLFCGPRGTGKTTTARVLAKALNCEKGPTPHPCNVCRACEEIAAGTAVDVLEIDGASNTGVDDVRQLRENARYLPVTGRRKIYIIDEVHMLSVSAFNALLKTLEEPPPHVTFIFATTEPHKIPVTILSRCQRYDLGRVGPELLVRMLSERLPPEGIVIDPEGLALVAQAAEGSVRDALSLVDQVVSFSGPGEIDIAKVREALGLSDSETLLGLSEAVLRRDGPGALAVLEGVYRGGQDLVHFSRSFLAHLRDLTVAALVSEPGDLIQASGPHVEALKAQVAAVDPLWLQQLFDRFAVAADRVARSDTPRLVLEMAVVGLIQAEPMLPLGDLLERLEALEARLSGGAPPPQRGPARPGGAASRGAAPAPQAPARPAVGGASPGAPPRASESGGGIASGAGSRADDDRSPAAPRQGDGGALVAALPDDPMQAWEELVRLAERHSRRLAANLYRASLLSLSSVGGALQVEIGLRTGSFELRQIQTPGTIEELSAHLGRSLGRAVRLLVSPLEEGAEPGAVAVQRQEPPEQAELSPGRARPEPSAEPAHEEARGTGDSPRSLLERDEAWRREERARKRQEALSHAAVRDAVEVLEGSVQDIHVIVD
ncbi:MAG: DNA polymerase III subunit gamma/tau [Polyangia bacterium]|nr:DNA polymerase III subunit gamma/tau [Polyangia bacterium]